jgi:hypothetical protein
MNLFPRSSVQAMTSRREKTCQQSKDESGSRNHGDLARNLTSSSDEHRGVCSNAPHYRANRSFGSAVEGTSEDSMDLLTHSSVLIALTIEQRSIESAILPRSFVK